jgi:hypothetical protein
MVITGRRVLAQESRAAEDSANRAGRYTVSGTVFDSLTRHPLAGAHVHLADAGRDVVADSLGAFAFDNVTVGTHTVWADHPLLDKVGLYALSATIEVTRVKTNVVELSVPSFSTLWRQVCGTEPAPIDGDGIVFGQARFGALASSAPPTEIDIAWLGDSSDRAGDRRPQKTRSSSTASDGTYVLCGLPSQRLLTLSAVAAGTSTIPISFRIGAARIARRDMTIPSIEGLLTLGGDQPALPLSRAADGAVLAGAVRDSVGQPIRDARITISGVAGEWRSNSDGRFLVRGLPAGTRVIAVRALSLAPERRLVDFSGNDSAYVDLSLMRLVTTLATVTVRERQHFDAVKDELNQRRRAGFGYRADSLEFAKVFSVGQALNFPGVHVTTSGGTWGIYMTGVYSIASKGAMSLVTTCKPTVWFDGAKTDWEMVNSVSKDEVALVEIYNSAARTPLQFSGGRTLCGVVLVWSKRYVNPPHE